MVNVRCVEVVLPVLGLDRLGEAPVVVTKLVLCLEIEVMIILGADVDRACPVVLAEVGKVLRALATEVCSATGTNEDVILDDRPVDPEAPVPEEPRSMLRLNLELDCRDCRETERFVEEVD